MSDYEEQDGQDEDQLSELKSIPLDAGNFIVYGSYLLYFHHIIKVDNAKDTKKISRKELKKQQKKLEYENELKALGSKLYEQSLDNASTTKG
jgi:hypothetical protein